MAGAFCFQTQARTCFNLKAIYSDPVFRSPKQPDTQVFWEQSRLYDNLSVEPLKVGETVDRRHPACSTINGVIVSDG
jgi:hypothetical protein